MPDNVRAAAEAAPEAFVPVRVIEKVCNPSMVRCSINCSSADDEHGHPSREVALVMKAKRR